MLRTLRTVATATLFAAASVATPVAAGATSPSPITTALPPGDGGAPCYIAGYTNHAKLQMSTRDLSQAEVRWTVVNRCRSAVFQDNGNWFYRSGTSSYPCVVMSTTAWVVSAYEC